MLDNFASKALLYAIDRLTLTCLILCLLCIESYVILTKQKKCMVFRSHLIYLSFCVAHLISATELAKDTAVSSDFVTLARKNIPLRSDGKIDIPSHIKHVKLDIGLSYNAPMSQYWLSHEDDLMVFGFEPNPACVTSILQGAIKRHPAHGEPLNKKFIGKTFS